MRPPAIFELRRVAGDAQLLAAAAARHGVAPMGIRDQMTLQLAYLQQALLAAAANA